MTSIIQFFSMTRYLDLHDIKVLLQELSFVNGCPPWSLMDPRIKADAWELMWHDLKTKASRLPETERVEVLIEGVMQRLIADRCVPNGDLTKHLEAFLASRRPRFAAVIFTVLPVEFNMAACVLGIDADPKDRFGKQCYEYCTGKLARPDGQTLSVCVVKCGQKRNVPMAICVRDALEAFSSQICILSGIAAGYRREVRLGDVVAAEQIIDYEGGLASGLGWLSIIGDVLGVRYLTKRELISFPVPKKMGISGFSPAKDWLDHRDEFLRRALGNEFPILHRDPPAKYLTGIICSGEKVRRDAVLRKLNKEVDRKIYALDMEGSGFAAACEGQDMNWSVFRGISDFGDHQKDDGTREIAALHSALAIRSFLRSVPIEINR